MVYNVVEQFQRLQVALSQVPVMDHNCVTWTMDIILSAKKDKPDHYILQHLYKKNNA